MKTIRPMGYPIAMVWLALALSGMTPARAQSPLDKPVRHRLYARDAQNRCAVPYEVAATGANDSLILEVHADGALQSRLSRPDLAGKVVLPASIAAGLVSWRFTLLSRKGAALATLATADSIACGDAFIIYGQSNAEAFSGWSKYVGADSQKYASRWIRSYQGSWVVPNARQTGVWGMHIARMILEKHKVPVAILNAAKGNTTIEQLGPDYVVPAAETEWIADTRAYGNFYKRMTGWAREAGLTGGVRAILWHQGERNVYGSDFTEFLKYDYRQAFRDLRKRFQADFPGLRNIFTFQIKTGCGVDSHLWSRMFDAQRRLAGELPDVEIMSTLNYDIVGCHYSDDRGVVGYTLIGDMLFRQLDSVYYGGAYPYPLSPPNLVQAAYTSARRDEVVLLFDQDVRWNDSLVYDPASPVHVQHFPGRPNPASPTYLKGLFGFDSLVLNQVESGSSQGRKVFLKLKAGGARYKQVAYPHGNLPGTWPGPFLTGPKNGLGAMGFLADIDSALSPTAAYRQPAPAGGGMRLRHVSPSRVTVELPRGAFAGSLRIPAEVRDPSGRVVLRGMALRTSGDAAAALDLRGLPPGLHVLVLGAGGRVLTARFASLGGE